MTAMEQDRQTETIGNSRRAKIHREIKEKADRFKWSPDVMAAVETAAILKDGLKLGEMGIDLDMPVRDAEKIIAEKTAQESQT